MSGVWSSAVALVGVLVGAGIGWWAQIWAHRFQQKREELVHRRLTVENFVAAHRDFRRFLMQAETSVRLVDNADRGPIPVVADSRQYWAALDRASIAFTMLPPSLEAKAAADDLRLAWYGIAEARASYDAGHLPDAVLARMKDAEETFLVVARETMLADAR